MATLIYASGADNEELDIKTLTLERIQQLVNGYVEVLKPKSFPVVLVVNDEARLTGLPLNREATLIYGAPVLGNAVLLTDKEAKEILG